MVYLSVHDIVWVNTTLMGSPTPYHYEKLEACMAAQYQYGSSSDVPAQAAAFLESLLEKRPFYEGNLQTGFVCVAAFLAANGFGFSVGAEELVRIITASGSPGSELSTCIAPTGTAVRPGFNARQVVTYLLHQYREVVAQLAQSERSLVAA